MKKLLLLFGLCTMQTPQAQDLHKNVAYADNHVRFTVISDGAVRMEYAPDGQFVDAKSFVAVQRAYPAADYRVKRGAWIEIATPKMVLRYRKNSGPFTASNLSVRSPKRAAVPFVWKPGMQQKGNLKGTYRTLDGYDGDTYVYDERRPKMPIEDGLLATDGWTLIDDSDNFLFDGDKEWEWVEKRPDDGAQDWYFLAYGHDYKAALRDFTLFAGKMPLPPRYAFGYWWSRYWAYSDKELRTLVKNFRAYDIPLDVLVIDMDWHYTDGDRGGWTGWSWNRTLFPDPAKFLRWLDGEGIRSTFNLHPADGVRCGEDSYADVACDMGIDPASKQTVPWVSSDKKFIRSIFRRILTPMERDGVDFWWLDWQQQPTDPAVEGLSNTWWLNYVFFSDMEKSRDVRPMLYHRWGGLGNHRYQIGFSGDASITWASLDFQPYFNSTASNVLYGYWSHDIGGHHMADRIDPELYIRWMQFGALSPVMRTHSAKSAGLKKEVWNFAPEHADILRSTIRQRYALAPYIYTMARKAYDEGISLCRPMYYEWPEASEAYAFRNQYLFGDDILVAPVTAPGKEGYATVKVWLPEGKWYEWQTGTMLDGGRTVERTFALDEYPVYVRAGAILPMYGDKVKNLNANDEEILLTLFPGGSDEFSLYEDNGDDKRYAAEFARTHLKSVRDGNLLTVTVGKRTGAYRGMLAERKFSVKVLASAAPASVTVDGAKADWTYLGEEFALVVEIPRTDCAAEKVVCIRYEDAEVDFNGVPAAARRMARAMEEFKYHAARKPWEQSWRYTYTDEFGPMGSIAEAVEYAPERIPQLIGEFRKAYDDLPGVLRRQGLSQEESEWFFTKIGIR
ncbi:glycoside hydrolase family 31 protein [Alistipes timonensis]|uniref:glycoside hydrolase family 31 protein n=1 Tax=Alistipes timonensis TaxID=1465754 RepID=UPI001C3C9CDB|nr:glycoside hydrolase family 31 protein [Alistipes timonensis]MCR2031875.1 glycoside hydrolase family 31 protein [Alistipes timonensis]